MPDISPPAPPLEAERSSVNPEALPDLLPVLLRREADTHGRRKFPLSEELVAALARWPWPGGLDELRLRVKLAIIVATTRPDDGQPLRLEDFGLTATLPELIPSDYRPGRKLAELDFKFRFCRHYLEAEEGFVHRAAARMGMPRPSLSTMLGQVGLDSAEVKRRARQQDARKEGKRKRKSKASAGSRKRNAKRSAKGNGKGKGAG